MSRHQDTYDRLRRRHGRQRAAQLIAEIDPYGLSEADDLRIEHLCEERDRFYNHGTGAMPRGSLT